MVTQTEAGSQLCACLVRM